MKPLFAALLAGLLCMQTVSSLVCFTCDKENNNDKCLNINGCKDTDRYCVTKYYGTGFGENHQEVISKQCSAYCPAIEVDIGVMAFSLNCCKSSLCNRSGAVSVKMSSLLLLVGTLASFFYIIGAHL